MADPNLRIRIETPADTSGAEAASRAVEDLADKAKQAAADVGELNDAADQFSGAAAETQDTAAAVANLGEEAGKAAVETESLREEVEGLGEAKTPEAAAAMQDVGAAAGESSSEVAQLRSETEALATTNAGPAAEGVAQIGDEAQKAAPEVSGLRGEAEALPQTVPGAEATAKAVEKIGSKAEVSAGQVDSLQKKANELPASAAGAEATARAVEKVGAAAEKAAGQMDNLARSEKEEFDAWEKATFGEIDRKLDAMEARNAAPTLPSAGGDESLASIMATTLAYTAAAGAVGAFLYRLADGAKTAAETARTMQDMDEATRKATIEGMGPLGDVIGQNMDRLAAFADDMEQVTKKVDDFWTAAGARLAPALGDVADGLAKVDTAASGAALGDIFGGAFLYANDLFVTIGKLSGVSDEAAASAMGIRNSLIAAIPGGTALLDTFEALIKKSRGLDDSESARQAASERQAAAADAVFQRQKEQQLSTAEQIAIAQDRQNQAIASGRKEEAVALVDIIAKLQARQQAEKDTTAQQDKSKAETLAQVQARIALNEAVAAGDQAAQAELRSQQEYQSVLKQTGNEELARRAQAADLAARQRSEEDRAAEKSRSDAEAQIRDQMALEREKAQTRLKELEASGASDSALAQQRQDDLEVILSLEARIAELKGKSSQQAAVADEQRKQAAIEAANAQKREAVAALESRKALIDAEGQKRRALLESQGLGENDLAKRRLALEDDIASRRLEVENQIGALQGENDDARAARQISADAERIARQNAETERVRKQVEQLRTGPDGKNAGEIDGRTGLSREYGLDRAHFGSGGQLISAEKNGVPLTPDQVGAINSANPQPSALDLYKGDQPGQAGYQPIVPEKTAPAPAIQPPGQDGQRGQGNGGNGSQGGGGSADAAKELEQVKAELDRLAGAVKAMSGEIVGGVQEAASAVDAAAEAISGALKNLRERVESLEKGNT